MNTELTTGNYDKAYKYATGTDTILDNYHLIIDRLGATREEIGKNLHSDEPVDVDTITHVEPDLIFDYDVVPALDAAADTAVENGLNMAETIQQMINMAKGVASEYLNFTTAQEQLEDGIKKIKRVQNYKEAFDKFAKDMSNFEAEMSMDLAAKMKEIGDTIEAEKIFERLESNKKLRGYYLALPDNMRNVLCSADFVNTDDGFFMCKKSLKEIFIAMGIPENESLNNGTVVPNTYDDWYFAGLINANGEIIYTLVKMREPGDNQNGKGSALSFVELDVTKLGTYLNKIQKGEAEEKDKDSLYKILYEVTNGKKKNFPWGTAEANKDLIKYFEDKNSEGSYLIADQFIDKFISGIELDENGNCNISARYDEQVSWCREKLDELEKKGVYDKANSLLHIEDSNNLTDDEKSAVMIILTGNPDIYSYAAENQYHAIKYGELFGLMNSHAIISDAGVGESALGEKYEESFKDETGKYYKEQIDSHKK